MIYIVLILSILIVSFLSHSLLKKANAEAFTLKISFILIWLVCVLRSTSVGRDIPGYEKMYDAMSSANWSNFDLFWVEPGYEFLMMVGVHILHVPFQFFMAVIYFFVFYSYYKFIDTYSKNVTLSILIYLTFSYFTFDLSGIRTTLSVAICLLGFLQYRKRQHLVFYFCTITIASTIHSTAVVFYLIPLMDVFDLNFKNIPLYLCAAALPLIFKSYLYTSIVPMVKNVQETDTIIGGRFLIYNFILVISIYLNRQINIKKVSDVRTISIFSISQKLLLFSSILYLFSGTGTLIRAATGPLFFLVLLIPNSLSLLDLKTKSVLTVITIIFFVSYFVYFELIPNNLDILPYRFFWEN